MDRHFPASQTTSLRNLYQDLHAIVAEAGYLSIGMRWSANIFRFSSPFPGQAWDLDQQHVDDAPYIASVAASDRADKMDEARWKAEAERIRLQRSQLAQNATAGGPQTPRDWKPAFVTNAMNKIKTAWEGAKPGRKETPLSSAWYRPSRLAKVHIVIWPMLQRFATVGKIDPATGAADGETITTVFKAQVVYYSGRVDQSGGQSEDHPTLEEWVHEKKQSRIRALRRPLHYLAYVAGVLVILSLLAPYSRAIDDVQQIVRYALLGAAKYAIREALLLAIEVAIIAISLVLLLVKFMTLFVFVVNYSIVSLFGFVRSLVTGDWDGFRNGLRAGWDNLVVQWPRLGLGWVRDMAKGIVGNIAWKTLSVDIPTGFGPA
ncbi:hypothetical protein BT67DRAFT_439586 [Trichocladium antarcticum]|uniref:Uncharacterized protein n=1 Tax=Trichocladium antarcticum TaxID=1450529 RepID=A0AAN6UPQ0_9PEZI|nr:hypothetical protein BT67DRAFT_439586 [Trichocladium antarcticum]